MDVLDPGSHLEKGVCSISILLLLKMCYQPQVYSNAGIKSQTPTCNLCSHANETLRHILCGCQAALGQGRQTWRHDSILLALYQHFRLMRNRGAAAFKSKRKPKVAKSSFVSAKGNRFDTADSTMATPLFEASDDWQLQLI